MLKIKKIIIILGVILAFLNLLLWLIDLGKLSYILRLGYFYDFYTDKSGIGYPKLENFVSDFYLAKFINYLLTYLFILCILTVIGFVVHNVIKKIKYNEQENSTHNIYYFLSSLFLILFQLFIYII